MKNISKNMVVLKKNPVLSLIASYLWPSSQERHTGEQENHNIHQKEPEEDKIIQIISANWSKFIKIIQKIQKSIKATETSLSADVSSVLEGKEW